MSGKNAILTIITLALFGLGYYAIDKSNSLTSIFAILLAMYVTLQSAIETADFRAQSHKECFVFGAKVLVTFVTCLTAILIKHEGS